MPETRKNCCYHYPNNYLQWRFGHEYRIHWHWTILHKEKNFSYAVLVLKLSDKSDIYNSELWVLCTVQTVISSLTAWNKILQTRTLENKSWKTACFLKINTQSYKPKADWFFVCCIGRSIINVLCVLHSSKNRTRH